LASFAAAADVLRDEGILAADERRYTFAHELFADWTRLEWVHSRDDRLSALDGKSKLPTWHRAVRLTALSLLREQASRSGQMPARVSPKAQSPCWASCFSTRRC
jgi:hypothetical protein